MTSRFSAMQCTRPEHELHSLSRLKTGLKLRAAKKVIVCWLSYYMSVLKKNIHLTVKRSIRYCEAV